MYKFENNKNLTKYHKIRNVDLTVCTAEAKIAYNYAWVYGERYRYTDKFMDYYNNAIEIEKCDLIDQIIKEIQNSIVNYSYEDFSRYSLDYIIACLRYGFKDYFESGCPILHSYEEIGKIFKSNYLNQAA